VAEASDPEAVAEPPVDPAAVLHSRTFAVLLVFVAVVGVVVSLLAWGFLELVFQTQVAVFTDLPRRLGFDTTPTWWPLPVLGIAGVLTSLAIVYLPGRGGHVPADGLQVGGTEPITVPGIALAAFATLALGLVLGPEAPLIAIGGGLGTFAVRRARRDAQPQVITVVTLEENPHHRRASLVVLTDKGRRTYDEAGRLQAPWANALSEDLAIKDIDTTRRVVAELRKKLVELNGERAST
jgi:hypothetical protein